MYESDRIIKSNTEKEQIYIDRFPYAKSNTERIKNTYIQRERDYYSINLSILNISLYSDGNLFWDA